MTSVRRPFPNRLRDRQPNGMSICLSLVPSIILLFGQCAALGAAAFVRDELKADCGRAVSRVSTGNSGELVPSALGSSPWHAVIYKVSPDDPNNWEFTCSGNIIAPDIVITAASCVFIEYERIFYNASTFRVVAAKIHLSLNKDVENSQPREVKKISPHQTYTGEISVHTDNLAILVVEPPFAFNGNVSPICIDWDGKKTQLASSITTNIAGWGLRRGSGHSEVLQEGSFAIVPNRQCRSAYRTSRLQRYINYDKFCVVTPSVTEMYNSFAGRTVEDQGSGSVVNVGGKYYLQGIMSAFLGDNLTVATNITKHRKWLMDTVTHIWEKKKCQEGFLCDNNVCISTVKKCDGVSDCSDKSDESEETCKSFTLLGKGKYKHGRCTLPIQQSGVTYRIENCDEVTCLRLPGTSIGSGDKVEMKCGPGTTVLDNGFRFACIEGEWFPGRLTCVRMCPPRILHGVVVQCEHNRAGVNCSDFMSPGTVATATCQRLYKIKDPLLADERSKCMEGGKWSAELPTCVPECGLPNLIDSATPTITHGRNATYGKYPWHVGLYFVNRTTDTWEQFCGGTIITPTMVLTAAHCLETFSAQDLLVAGGKVLRDLKENEEYQQTSLVRKKFVPDLYEAYATRYEYDIALLGLVTPFNITDFVLPCCLDFLTVTTKFLNKVTRVSVAGWGFTEKGLKVGVSGNPSPVLKETQIPVVQTQECKKLDREFLQYFTFDKFCGFYRNGSGPQRGDSGGGVVVSNGDIYFVVGVISIKPTSSNLFGAFTNIGVHRDWIKETLRAQKRWETS